MVVYHVFANCVSVYYLIYCYITDLITLIIVIYLVALPSFVILQVLLKYYILFSHTFISNLSHAIIIKALHLLMI